MEMKMTKVDDCPDRQFRAEAGRVPSPVRKGIVAAMLLIHAFLLAYSAKKNSWTWDEVAFLPAGISHWKFGDFELFDVNPPLVRMVASLPVLFADPELNWDGYTTSPTARPERPIGENFLRNNGERSFFLLTIARWACIPFSLLGGFICYHWSRQLFGEASGFLTLFLWTFSPTIIAHGQLITADVGGASLGIAAFYLFWRWLQDPSWKKTVQLGLVMGILELTKSTWIILFGLWPAIWLIWRLCLRGESESGWLFREGRRLAIAFVCAIYLLNLGYCFQGTGRNLGDFEFISTAVGGPLETGVPDQIGNDYQGTIRNRFKGTLLGSIPIPLPQKYVEGIDRQKFHFECENWSYLRGEWKAGGWLYYYAYALAVKTPHGTWLVMLAAVMAAVIRRPLRGRKRDNLLLGGTMILLFAFISLQTGINRHARYVMPVLPFAFILAGRAGKLFCLKNKLLAAPVAAGCGWLVISSLQTFPHHLSYFNELAGGPKNGAKHLSSSNVDWGQDLLHLKEWLDRNPAVKLDGLAWHCRVVDPAIAGIEANPVPGIPQPGWYALSVNLMHQRSGSYNYLQEMKPVAWAGYSIPIFHISHEEAERARQIYGYLLPGEDLISEASQVIVERGASPLFVTYSDTRGQLIAGTDTGTIATYDPQALSSVTSRSRHNGRASSGRFSADGRKLAIGWSDGTVRFHENPDAEPIIVSPDVGSLRAVDLSPDGQFLAIAGESGVVELRGTGQPKDILFRLKHDLPVLSVRFADHGKMVATGTGNSRTGVKGRARLWDSATGDLIKVLPHSCATVEGMSASPDGTLVAGRGDGGSIQLWEVDSNDPTRSLPNSRQILVTQFTMDGRYLVGGDCQGYLKAWDVRTGKLILTTRAHKGIVSGCCCAGSSGYLATAGGDGWLKVWDATAILGNAPKTAPESAAVANIAARAAQ